MNDKLQNWLLDQIQYLKSIKQLTEFGRGQLAAYEGTLNQTDSPIDRRKIIQISPPSHGSIAALHALCKDGTLWKLVDDEWQRQTDIPGKRHKPATTSGN